MSCVCRQADDHAERRAGEVLEHAGLGEIVEQGRGAVEEASRALNHLARAERAVALGFGEDVARMHRDAAIRSNQRARQQFGFLVERIDARRQADDWAGIVERAETSFRERDGSQRLQDARADVRVRLLDEDSGMSAAVAEQTLALFDHVLERARGGSLNAVLDLMRESCEAAQEGLASEEMGRQPAPQVSQLFRGGPSAAAGGQNVNGWCVALTVCLIWANSSFIAATIICIVWSACAFYPLLLAVWGAHNAACNAAFLVPCATGK